MAYYLSYPTEENFIEDDIDEDVVQDYFTGFSNDELIYRKNRVTWQQTFDRQNMKNSILEK